jgi:predicted NBD/HSP70 family sugar kinase
LREDLANKFKIPVAMENDANAGALAEWNAVGSELLYWALGGGWGGAWVSQKGEIKFSSLNWDGNDATLHLTNEPGFATPITKSEAKKVFDSMNLGFSVFEKNLQSEFGGKLPLGPSQDPLSYRAENFVSGTGLFRLFRLRAGNDPQYRHICDASVAGKQIDDLAKQGDGVALLAFELFGKLMALAGEKIIRKAMEDGANERVAVFVGGKPAHAFPFFGPHAQAGLREKGILSMVKPSLIFTAQQNANLLGAGVLAKRAWESGRRGGIKPQKNPPQLSCD